ncbi:MAG: hypothetical protein LBC73_11060 [Oscillospiraceae bacterium]|jgi:glycerophosphoryl diester phosphodiesterase|nr:hypothetical protein [Oscillospiraceae bacterium]
MIKIKKSVYKILTFVLIFVVTMGVVTPVASAVWRQDNVGWWWQYNTGGYARGWLSVNGTWYYFNSSGYMQTGWIYDGGTWYYLRPSGAMATGWINDGGTWYFLRPNGAMATGWINDRGTWYYLQPNGAMATGWINDKGSWYFLKSNGAWTEGLPEWVINSNRLVAHAGGGFNGIQYLNTIEAVEYNYKRGQRVFEFDFSLTSDNVLVGKHHWGHRIYVNGAPTLEVFLSNKVLGMYTPTKFDDIAWFLYHHPDAYLVTDKIFEYDDAAFQYMIDTCLAIDPAIMDRIIVQVFSESGFYTVAKNYPQFDMLYTLYVTDPSDADIIRFVDETGLRVITMWDTRAHPTLVDQLKQRETVVFAHTVNSLDTFNALRKMGVYGIYTDFIYFDGVSYYVHNS